MAHLNVDIETYSSVPIAKAGAYAYSMSDDFEILLFSYSLDRGPVQTVDLAQGEDLPPDILHLLSDPECVKHAYNASFEITCLTAAGYDIHPDQWRDTMLHGLYCGYTAGLDATGKALGLPEDKQKLRTGSALIRYFSVPCKPSKSNGGRTRNLPHHDPEKWYLFKQYNAQDVTTEMEIESRLSCFPVPDFVQAQWVTDLRINARGVQVDMDLCAGALKIGAEAAEALTDEAKRISGLENPNSVSQLMKWLNAALGEDDQQITNVTKDTVSQLLQQDLQSDTVRRMLEIRQELGKTSTKKYNALEACVCPDSKVRGLLQFYGARTGRWAGRLVQVQNLPQTHLEALSLAREIVRRGDTETLKLIYGSAPQTLSQLIRTAFTASPGHVLIDADFSAIEARVISWLAGEEWRLEAFRQGRDIYCENASRMFGVPVVKGGENGHLRARGKVAELACIAAGSQVLTNNGWKPIESVAPKDKVWDGEQWVRHGGVVYRGRKKCILYDNLVATPDHLVYLEGLTAPAELGYAAEHGLILAKTESKPAWRRERISAGPIDVYDIRDAGPNHRYTVEGHLVHNCGYGGGVGAMRRMDSGHNLDDEPDSAIKELVNQWREANPKVRQMWQAFEDAAVSVIRDGGVRTLYHVTFARETDLIHGVTAMTILLPSGRRLYYINPGIGTNRFGAESITYTGMEQTSRQWKTIETYGARLVENVTQAIARDCLAEAIERLEAAGYPIVFHIHDEVVIDIEPYADEAKMAEDVANIMKEPIPWAPGLPLNVEARTWKFFQKG